MTGLGEGATPEKGDEREVSRMRGGESEAGPGNGEEKGVTHERGGGKAAIQEREEGMWRKLGKEEEDMTGQESGNLEGIGLRREKDPTGADTDQDQGIAMVNTAGQEVHNEGRLVTDDLVHHRGDQGVGKG